MRINRLDLTRYGIFSDYSINFPGRKDGETDLHVIYGLNETGKSTALAGFLDLLFGIETRSPYNFLHPYQTMRIGGSVEIGGHTHEFSRIKRPRNSLLDRNGKPVADSVILGDLGDIDRTSYKTMFSLDDDTLEKGGESILASEGDLGQLLFSASSGLSDISSTLDNLKKEADRFYRFRRRSGELSDLRKKLAELKKQRDDIDTAAAEYSRLIEARDQACVQYEKAMEERRQIQEKRDALQGQSRALPRLNELREIREQLGPLLDIPEAPHGWFDKLHNIKEADTQLKTKADNIEAEIERIGDELSKIVFDESVINLAHNVKLLKNSHARYMTADKDLPSRNLEQKEVDLSISGVLRQIGQKGNSDPARLQLSASVTGTLRDLMEERSGIDVSIRTAQDELDSACSRLKKAKKDLKALVGDTQQSGEKVLASISSLKSVLSATRDDNHSLRISSAKQSRKNLMSTLAERMLLLHPWTGEAKELERLSIPDANDIKLWKNSMDNATKRIERHKDEIEKLTAKQRRLEAEIKAARQLAGVVGNKEAAEARAAREKAWSDHKRTLDEESARVFEAALRHDDMAVSSQMSHAAEAAKLNQNIQTLAGVEADLGTAKDGRAAAMDDMKDVEEKTADAIRVMTSSMPEDLSLPKLEDWLAQREKSLEIFSEVKREERAIEAAEEDGKRIRSRLTDAAKAAGISFPENASVNALVSIVQETVDRGTELENLQSDIKEHENDVDIRKSKVKKEKAALEDWMSRWTRLCADCWLGKEGVNPQVPEIREILKALDELTPLIEKRSSLAERIRKMENDQLNFTAEVKALAGKLGIDTTLPPLEMETQIENMIDEAISGKGKHEEVTRRLEEARRRRQSICEETAIHDSLKNEMTEHFKVDSLLEVDSKLRQTEKRNELRGREETAKREILDALGVDSLDIAEKLLHDVERATVNSEIEELKIRLGNHDELTQELFSKYKEASQEVEAVGGDDAAARLEEKRRLVMLEIEDGALRYLRLKLGIVAAERALRIYRDRHRSSMMDRASRAFQTISRGAYRKLSTQPERDSEILIAVSANDASKIVSALSKGTRFQLYLALRVAGYHEFAQSRRPVPFIADDIMETFDDFRAEEAFRLFAEMAKVGQVIYLTHHKHLCRIAQDVCPEVHVHELATS